MLLSIVLSRILYYIDSIKDLDLDPDKEESSLPQKSGPYDDSWLLRPLVNIQRCMQQLFQSAANYRKGIFPELFKRSLNHVVIDPDC